MSQDGVTQRDAGRRAARLARPVAAAASIAGLSALLALAAWALPGDPRWPAGAAILAAAAAGLMGAQALLAGRRLAAMDGLRRGEARWRSLAQDAPVHLVAAGLDGRVTATNGRIPGPAGGTMGRPAWEPWNEAAPAVHAAILEVLATGEPRAVEAAGPGPDGDRRDYSLTWAPVQENGRLAGLVGMASDVTAARRAERERDAARDAAAEHDRAASLAQAAAEQRYRLLAEHSGDLVQQFDVRGVCTYASPSSKAVLGYEPSELVGQDSLHLLDPKDRAALAAGRTLQRFPDGRTLNEVRARRKDGSWAWLETVSRGLAGPDGRPQGTIATSRDITARKEAELQLAATNRRLALVIESSPLAIVQADGQMRVRGWNRAAEGLFGWRAFEVVGAAMPILAEPDTGGNAVFDTVALRRGLPVVRKNVPRRRRDGTTVRVDLYLSPLVDADGRLDGVMAIAVDLTAQIEAASHRAQVAQLQEVAAFKTQFLNAAAHELATPLTPLKLVLANLMRTVHTMPRQEAESLELLQRNVNRLSTLVNDLLDAARLQSGHLRLLPKPVQLDGLAGHVAATFGMQAREAGITLTVRQRGAPPTVVGDESRLAQVLVNLVHNALKFTPRGGHVRLLVAAQGDQGVIEVRDDGVGLDRSQMDRLFQPFTQVHDTMRAKAGGTGLGLYIAKGIVEQHGGSMAVASDGPGLGTTFTVSLPLRPAAPAEAPSGSPRRAPASS